VTVKYSLAILIKSSVFVLVRLTKKLYRAYKIVIPQCFGMWNNLKKCYKIPQLIKI
jgi:hypothetical protein